jgi:hypothetical protein
MVMMRNHPLLTGLMMLLSCGSIAPAALSYPFSTVQTISITASHQQSTQASYSAAVNQSNGKVLEHSRDALKLPIGDLNAKTVIGKLAQNKQYKGLRVTPPGIGAPTVRARGATRDQNCLDGKKLVAIIPENELGLTSLAQPTLLFYIPPTLAKSLQVRLEDTTGVMLYERTLKTPLKPGLAEFNFADFQDSPDLKSEVTYKWMLTLHCNLQDPSANVTVSGMFKRIDLDPTLVHRLEAASPRELINLYALNGLWYDTVKTLAKARQANPTDAELAQAWSELLQSVDLNKELAPK